MDERARWRIILGFPAIFTMKREGEGGRGGAIKGFLHGIADEDERPTDGRKIHGKRRLQREG